MNDLKSETYNTIFERKLLNENVNEMNDDSLKIQKLNIEVPVKVCRE